MLVMWQEEAETGDEIPEEDEVVGPKEAVVVTVPADFTLEESCEELINELASVIYRSGFAPSSLFFCRHHHKRKRTAPNCTQLSRYDGNVWTDYPSVCGI